MNVIAPAYLSELIEDIGTSSYSIILDESTDIGTKKYMAFCVRYYSCTYLDYMKNIFEDITNENITREINVQVLQNSLKLPKTHLPYNYVDFGRHFKELSRISLEKKSINQVKLNLIMERAAKFLFRLCHEIVEILPQNLAVIEKL